MKHKLSLLLLLLITSLPLWGCTKSEPITQTGIYFDTVISITVYDSSKESLIQDCFNKCDKYEEIFSKTSPDSELYKLNNGLLTATNQTDTEISYQISTELAYLIEEGLKYSELSGGLFDITISPLSDLWNFHTETKDALKVPDATLIDDACKKINYTNVSIDNNTITLKKASASDDWPTIDLGALAKGYIADELGIFLKANDCNQALINLGGNILCIGEKEKDTPFTLGIQKPFGESGENITTINVSDTSVVTSGNYERYFREGDKLYHHILNPKTGYPFENDLNGVTIICESSLKADAMSTICFALGKEKGMELIKKTEGVEAIFVDKDNQCSYSY